MRRTDPDLTPLRSTSALPYSAEEIEAALEGVVLPERLERLKAVAGSRVGSVTVVLEAVIDPHNTAAVLRTADAHGVGEVHLIERGLKPLLAKRVTRGCERWMDVEIHRETQPCVEVLRERGFEIWLADMDGTATLEEVAESAGMFYQVPHLNAEQLAEILKPEARAALSAFADACAGIDWTREAIAALVKQTVSAHGMKMPQFGLPARQLIFGRPQTPALEAVLLLLPRETVIHRLRVGLAHAL